MDTTLSPRFMPQLDEVLKAPRRCLYGAPDRFWYQRRNGLWASRDWKEGEREAYQREVLGWN